MRLNSPKNLLEFVRSARVVEDADPYRVSLAEFARQGKENDNPFLPWVCRGKNTLRRSVTRALMPTNRGEAEGDGA